MDSPVFWGFSCLIWYRNLFDSIRLSTPPCDAFSRKNREPFFPILDLRQIYINIPFKTAIHLGKNLSGGFAVPRMVATLFPRIARSCVASSIRASTPNPGARFASRITRRRVRNHIYQFNNSTRKFDKPLWKFNAYIRHVMSSNVEPLQSK